MGSLQRDRPECGIWRFSETYSLVLGLAADTLTQRIHEFRLQRIDAILRDDTPKPLLHPHRFCLHLIPTAAFNPSFSVAFQPSSDKDSLMQPIAYPPCTLELNFEGWISHSGRQGTESCYVQLFRNGILEAVDCQMMLPPETDSPGQVRNPNHELKLYQALGRYRKLLAALGVPLPVIVALSVLNVGGFVMGKDYSDLQGFFMDFPRPFPKRHLLLPERVITAKEATDIEVLRPLFDHTWNAIGRERSPNWTEDGKWFLNALMQQS